MRVVLEPSLFEGSRIVELLTFLWIGLIGRHRIFVEETDNLAYQEFLGQLEPDLRDDWEETINACLSRDAMEPSFYEVSVARVSDSAWSNPPPRLTIDDALTLLLAPYRILVENGINDRAFLLALSSPEQRKYLEERIEREWLEVELCLNALIK